MAALSRVTSVTTKGLHDERNKTAGLSDDEVPRCIFWLFDMIEVKHENYTTMFGDGYRGAIALRDGGYFNRGR